MIPIQDLINYIKFQLSMGSNSDPVVSIITDTEIISVVQIQSGSLGLDYTKIPYNYMPILTCMVRKELYWKLATSSAPLTSMSTDGTSLNKNERFNHYTALIQEVTKEYEAILNDPSRLPKDFMGGKFEVKVFDNVIRKDYVLGNFVNNYVIPKIGLVVDNTTPEGLEISVDLSEVNTSDYVRTSLYLNEDRLIIDEYQNNTSLSEGTKLIYQTYDIHKEKFRIPCICTMGDIKHLAVIVELKYGLKAYTEIEVTI